MWVWVRARIRVRVKVSVMVGIRFRVKGLELRVSNPNSSLYPISSINTNPNT